MSEITFGGGTPKTGNEDYWQGNFPWIQSSDLKNDQLCNVIPTKFITDEAINKSATKAVPANSIAVVTRVGVGKLALMPYPYATSQDFLSLSNLKVDPWFGVYSLYVLIQKEINNIQGTSIKGMTKSDLLSKNIHIPFALDEQTKIGNFFKQLDDTIALHQRKSTLLKQLKQTYLKQIFPQNKENIPALRFAGFSEPWKQHKFDEVFSHVQNNSLSRADLNYNGGYAMNIHYGDILIRFGEYLDVSKCKLPMIANKQLVEKYKASFLKDGDIVIADAAEDETVGKCSELRGIEDANILAGLHTIPSRPNWTFAPGYLGYYMNSSAFHDQLLPLIQGTKISSISKSALKKTDIKYPYGKDEQTKIGNLFKQLDDSISLHQSKLEKLTDLKQVLLAKMFV